MKAKQTLRDWRNTWHADNPRTSLNELAGEQYNTLCHCNDYAQLADDEFTGRCARSKKKIKEGMVI